MIKDITREVQSTMGIYEGGRGELYGLLAEFPHPGALLHAAEAAREEGYRFYDTHSPFPIHGMDRAMGLGNSKVGFATLGGGITGLLTGFLVQWWTGAVDYPLNISGKPFFAVEPSVPVMFELTILFSAFGAVAGMLALNGLPRPYNPLFYSKNFMRASDDGFFMHVAASDKRFDRQATEAFLRDIGATHVEEIRDHETADDPDEDLPPAPASADVHASPTTANA